MTQRVMHTTKLFMSGKSQAIRIPGDYHLEDTELVINYVGESLIITPKRLLKQAFFNGIASLPEDFLAEGRPDETPNERITL